MPNIRSQLVSGYHGGAWDGPGIDSSSAAADSSTAVGYAEASQVLGPAGGTFAGASADATSILLRLTYCGDANLDGMVDVTDLGRLATNWQTAADWSDGDFNYDHFVDVTDLGALATNWQQGTTSAPVGAQSFASALTSVGLSNVPEPNALVLIALVARRRRRVSDER
jgi:hypothetical protein